MESSFPLHVCLLAVHRCALPRQVSCFFVNLVYFCHHLLVLYAAGSVVTTRKSAHGSVWVADGEQKPHPTLTSWQVENWVKNTFMENINFGILIYLFYLLKPFSIVQ